MRVVADVFRREMKANNQDTRGLDFELDEAGRLKVHLVKAKNPAVFYTGKPFNVDHLLNSQQQEIWETTGFSRNRPILVFSEAGAVAEARPIPQVFSGLACVSGDIFRDGVTATTIEEQIRNFMDSTMVARPGSTEKRPRNKESQTSNGVLIHDNLEVKRKTGAGKPEGSMLLPTKLQNHGNPVRFRNIWLLDRTPKPSAK